jgi:glycosyltransferase involved in cell wall biosynthesis
MAFLLARHGWKVHVLECGTKAGQPVPAKLVGLLARAGIEVATLDAFDLPAALMVPALSDAPGLNLSEQVRYALAELHARHHFDLVEFVDQGGLGFRAVQARRAGLAFPDLRMIVALHGSAQWLRESQELWIQDTEELETDYCERYAFDHADVQIGTSGAMLAYARTNGWRVREDALAVSLPSSTSWAESPDHKATAGSLADDQRIAADYCRLLQGTTDTPIGARQLEEKTEPSLPHWNRHPLVTVVIPFYNLGAYLPETLTSVAQQTYPYLEVVVINDGSTERESIAVFQEQRSKFPHFRFLEQANAGIGATRNRGLWEARGEFFLPMDADNIAFPCMIERFVHGMRRNPELAALTCYFLAFKESQDPGQGDFEYAFRPVGGPRVMASFRNVFGDATAIFRTEAFRAVGGYEIDRETSWEDWEAFLKLTNAGHDVDVIPEYLFAYRHRDCGFSRVTQAYRNHQRVLRQVFRTERLPPAETIALWTGLVGLQKRHEELCLDIEAMRARIGSWRYRTLDSVCGHLSKSPVLTWGIKCFSNAARKAWMFLHPFS